MSVEFVIEGRQRANDAAHHRHRVRVAAEAGEEARHLLMHHGVARHAIIEIVLLRLGRQLAVKQEIADFEEIAVLGELVDRKAAMQQYAFIAVDEGDLGFATCSRSEARVVGECPGVLVERCDVDDLGANGPLLDLEHQRLAAVFEFCRRCRFQFCRQCAHRKLLSILQHRGGSCDVRLRTGLPHSPVAAKLEA